MLPHPRRPLSQASLRILVSLILFVLPLPPQRSALAATADLLLVTNANDSGPGSLRQAIAEAQDGATITFASSFTIYLDSPLEISAPIALDATDQSVVVSGDSGHDGTRNVRPFTVTATGALTLTAMQVVSGTAVFGGGIYSEGTLHIIDSTFTDNRTSASDGAAIQTPP
jgi:hypothetical protein